MLADIFSRVDQGSSMMWITPLAVLLVPSRGVALPIVKKLSQIMKRGSIRDRRAWFRRVFVSVIILNLIGMVPFSFPLTSTIWFAATLGLIFWLSLLVAQVKIIPVEMTAHLSPSGAPFALSPLLVLIETISIIIRPLTLTVRLVANMTVGHIVSALVAVKLRALRGVWRLTFITIFYMLFEFGVCIVQAYIFTLLLTLYSEV
jgi:ATP synthase subunit 6